jgi:Family of unknown function (DUF5640)
VDATYTSRGAINDRARGRCRVFHSSSSVLKVLGVAVLALVLCCGIALAAAGCGEETAATTSTAVTAAPTTAAPPTTVAAAPPTTAAGAPPAGEAPGTTVAGAPPAGQAPPPAAATVSTVGGPVGDNPLVGKWANTDGTSTLEFTTDGTHTVTDSMGTSTFTYEIQGNNLVLGGEMGQLIPTFTIEGDTLTLVFSDMGTTKVFTRMP